MTISFTAGQRVTAAAINAFVPFYIRQASDQSLNSTTSTAWNVGAFTFAANETWVCEMVLDVDGVAASDIKVVWAVTGTVTTDRRHSIAQATTNAADPNVATVLSVQARATTSSTSYGVVPESGAVRGTLQEKFVVTSGASGGTLAMSWGCVAASGTVNVRAGSWFIAHRVS